MIRKLSIIEKKNDVTRTIIFYQIFKFLELEISAVAIQCSNTSLSAQTVSRLSQLPFSDMLRTSESAGDVLSMINKCSSE